MFLIEKIMIGSKVVMPLSSLNSEEIVITAILTQTLVVLHERYTYMCVIMSNKKLINKLYVKKNPGQLTLLSITIISSI